MEEFVCKAKYNLVCMVKQRLENKFSVEITMGEVIIDEYAEEQWISVTGGTEDQRKAAKKYLTTLCDSEDVYIFQYDEKHAQAFMNRQDEIEENSGACLVFATPGQVNIYGTDMGVTIGLSGLENIKENLIDKLPVVEPVNPITNITRPKPMPVVENDEEIRESVVQNIESMSEDNLIELLKIKCEEHDLCYDDYANVSVTVKRTLFSWLCEDMDKSNSLVDDIEVDCVDGDTSDAMLVAQGGGAVPPGRGSRSARGVVVRSPVGELASSFNKTLKNNDTLMNDSKYKIITNHGYTMEEYENVKKEIGCDKDISTILTKLLENRQKQSIMAKTADKPNNELMILDDDNVDLMVYFEEFYKEEPGLSREEYLEKNIKRQQLLLADIERRNQMAVSEKEETRTTPTPSTSKKGKKKKKKRGKKKKKGGGGSGNKSQQTPLEKSDDTLVNISESSSSSGDDDDLETDGDGSILEHPSLLQTIDSTGPDQTRLSPTRSQAREIALTHSPMAENDGNKKKAKMDTASLIDVSDTSFKDETIFGAGAGPMHSTPLPGLASRHRIGARFDGPGNDLVRRPIIEEPRPVKGRQQSRSRSRDRRSPQRGRVSPRRDAAAEGDGWTVVGNPNRVPMPMSDLDRRSPNENLRAIVIDGSNVACSHGRQKLFSCRGILLAVEYFKKRGHTDITAFVPNWRKGGVNSKMPTVESEILLDLEAQGHLSFTPSRYLNGRRITCYDDRFIIELAAESDGVVVSNDNYRDLINEKPQWKRIIESRLLMYTFAGDRFMVPDDPCGPGGPTLDDMLIKGRSTNNRKKSAPGVSAISQPAPPTAFGDDYPLGLGLGAGILGDVPKLVFPKQPGRPILNRAAPCRSAEKTKKLYDQLLELFPSEASVVQRILDNHIDETDLTKLTTHILDVLR